MAPFGSDEEGEAAIVVGPFEFWPAEGLLRVDGAPVTLGRREFQVLHVLMAAAGHVVARERILTDVWGLRAASPQDRSVDVHIRKLRAKLTRAAPRWDCIHTHTGVGYRFEPTLLQRSAAARRQAGTGTAARRPRTSS